MMNANDFDGAIAAYQAMLVKVPALTALHLQVGRAQRMKKDYDGALATYAKIPAGDPNAEKAKIEIGMTNLEKGDFPAADAALTEAAQSLSAGREVFYNLGEVKFAKGETDEAMKWYQRAVDVDANWAKPYFKLGLGKLQKADMPGAIEMMEKVIAVEPDLGRGGAGQGPHRAAQEGLSPSERARVTDEPAVPHGAAGFLFGEACRRRVASSIIRSMLGVAGSRSRAAFQLAMASAKRPARAASTPRIT